MTGTLGEVVRGLRGEWKRGRFEGECRACGLVGRRGRRPFFVSERTDGTFRAHCFNGCRIVDIADALNTDSRRFFSYSNACVPAAITTSVGGSRVVSATPHSLLTLHKAGKIEPKPLELATSCRHGEAIRKVVDDIALQAGLRLAVGASGPFMYAMDANARRLGVHPEHVRRALRYLVDSGQLHRAGALPHRVGEDQPRKSPRLYRLDRSVLRRRADVPAVTRTVEAQPRVALPRVEPAPELARDVSVTVAERVPALSKVRESGLAASEGSTRVHGEDSTTLDAQLELLAPRCAIFDNT